LCAMISFCYRVGVSNDFFGILLGFLDFRTPTPTDSEHNAADGRMWGTFTLLRMANDCSTKGCTVVLTKS
jgi:hypothetical protein